MRHALKVVGVAALLCASLACTPDLTGVWTIQFKRDSWDHLEPATCTFDRPHNQLRVECGHDTELVSAKLDGRHFVWQFKSGINKSVFATFTGELQPGTKTIKGTWEFADSSDNSSGGGTFEATR